MLRRFVLIALCSICSFGARAQFNLDRLQTSGEIALHYEDYVLSIQYFNQIISLRPYLYRPWQMRAVAKFYLEDYAGAESDATEALRLNPYIEHIWDLRAIARIRQENYADAADDYTRAIKISPRTQSYWYNRAICELNLKNYDKALLQTDTINQRWKNFANGYSLKAEIYLAKNDTVEAAKWLDRSLEIDPYDGNIWSTRASISLARQEWESADTCLSKAIHLKPKRVPNYLNRALARINLNNLRGAMSDYDTALDLDPNNFLAHYNRGLMRMQLGDDNRAIEDFDYVIEMEPENVLAIYNRALLRDKTGNLRGAVRDYTKVIDQFPNFWTGLQQRASCYRRLGMTAQAEKDEFRIIKAQNDKHFGYQPRWTEEQLQETRRRSEIDPAKYSAVVVDDEDQLADHEYQSSFRGNVQNRSVGFEGRALFLISLTPYTNGVKTYMAFDRDLERFNDKDHPRQTLFVACGNGGLSATSMGRSFELIDSLSADISHTDLPETPALLLQRAVAYASLQNYPDAVTDLDMAISISPDMMLAYWERAVCQSMINDFNISQGIESRGKVSMAIADFTRALELAPSNAYLYYNRGSLHASLGDAPKAIEDYTQAIRLEPHLAEAYYNRGLLYQAEGDTNTAVRDLSKAGELGLVDAYSIIKRISKRK